MLTIGRKRGEIIRVIVPPSTKPQTMEIVVSEAKRDRARIGFIADVAIKIHRKEVLDAIAKGENKPAVRPLIRIGEPLQENTSCPQ